MRSLGTFDNAESMRLASVEFLDAMTRERKGLVVSAAPPIPVKREPLQVEPPQEWTVKDDIALRGLWKQGHSQRNISYAMDRPLGSISSRIDALKLRGKGGAQKKLSGVRWSDGGAV